jgi:hypothetical protein
MPRLKSYLHIAAAQVGFAYIALWAITFVMLDYGPHLFAGACRPVGVKLLFYWACEPTSPLVFIAGIVNMALTVTVWAPVYVAAATVRPDAIALAAPILLVHLVGLPAAILVSIRLLARMFQAPRWIARRRGQAGAEDDGRNDDAWPPLRALPAPLARPKVKPRDTFGLRGQKP